MKLTYWLVLPMAVIACGSSSSDDADGTGNASAACSKACAHSADVCGVEPTESCAELCGLSQYSDAELDCITASESCDDAQRCGVNAEGVRAHNHGNGRIGETDPTGCAPYICICGDGSNNVCGSVGAKDGPCSDPTESVCAPNCRSHGGLVRAVPGTDLLCGG